MEFNQQTAIITGASRGIGRAIAELLADKGANVVINGTNEELLKSLCTQLNTERSALLMLPVMQVCQKQPRFSSLRQNSGLGGSIFWSTMPALICAKRPLIRRLKNGKE